MNPLELFEKLINEHGGAKLQKERIEFYREQFEVAVAGYEKRISDLRGSHKAEIDRLNAQYTTEIGELERKHKEELLALHAPADDLGEGEKKLIHVMATNGGRMILQEAAHVLGMTETKAKYHTENLRKGGLAGCGSHIPGGDEWHLTEAGTALAVENGLDSGGPRLQGRSATRGFYRG